jgi:heavy metal sensor kinase
LNRISISFRLTVWFTAVFLCGFVIFGLVMWADLAYSLSKGRDRTLTRRAARAVEVLSAYPADPPRWRAARYDEFAEATPEGNLIRVFEGGGRLLYPTNSTAPADFPWPKLEQARFDSFKDVKFRGRRYRVLQHAAALGPAQLLIVVAGQLEDNRQMLARFSAGLAGAIPLLLAASAFAGYFMSRRVLQPVDRLTATVRSISIGNLSERLPIGKTGDELQRLAETCNEMLARLEAAVAEIKRFTADASHELRSPMSYIRMVAESALRDLKLTSDSREAFEGILDECHQATRLLEDMLLLARTDAGNVDFRFEAVDLAELLKEVFDRARMPADAKNHRMSLRCGDGPCEVRGDQASLRRLVWTLLDNAIKYTPEGGRIDVALTPHATRVSLKVRDTGAGIPADLLPRIFDRFFRADPARSQGEGAGLGLAIAKWIADVHHAEIFVESAIGSGAAFTVVFPLEAQAAGIARRGL